MNGTRIVERELTAEQAQHRIEIELKSAGLLPTLRTFGQHVVSVHASLRCQQTHRQSRGAGKGYPQQARLGALYEALEHHWADDLAQADVRYVDADYFAGNPVFDDDSMLRRLAQSRRTRIACRTYTDLIQGDEFFYPVALTAPLYSQQPFTPDHADCPALARYASNSGTAIGASYDEALLHALNECIERDAVSLFLLNHFYYQNRSPLRRVDRVDETDPLGQLWTDAEREIGSPIVLADISTEFAARTFLAFSTAPDMPVRVFGSGCSLDSRHGALRALTELVQLHHAVIQPEFRRSQINAQRHLQRFPRLLRCLRFDVGTLLQLAPAHSVTLPDIRSESGLHDQIAQLVEDLHQHGRTPGVTTLHRSELGTTLVNVVIPGLERFFIVSSGNIVVPQARGRRLQHSAQEALA